MAPPAAGSRGHLRRRRGAGWQLRSEQIGARGRALDGGEVARVVCGRAPCEAPLRVAELLMTRASDVARMRAIRRRSRMPHSLTRRRRERGGPPTRESSARACRRQRRVLRCRRESSSANTGSRRRPRSTGSPHNVDIFRELGLIFPRAWLRGCKMRDRSASSAPAEPRAQSPGGYALAVPIRGGGREPLQKSRRRKDSSRPSLERIARHHQRLPRGARPRGE